MSSITLDNVDFDILYQNMTHSQFMQLIKDEFCIDFSEFDVFHNLDENLDVIDDPVVKKLSFDEAAFERDISPISIMYSDDDEDVITLSNSFEQLNDIQDEKKN